MHKNNNSIWLDSAAARAFDCDSHILIKTNLLTPKTTALARPGEIMPEWDPRGALACVTWHKIIRKALSTIQYFPLEKAVVFVVVRSPYSRFDPGNFNPDFAIKAMLYCNLITDVYPGNIFYGAIGVKDSQRGTDFYVGGPGFLNEIPKIIKSIFQEAYATKEADESSVYLKPSETIPELGNKIMFANLIKPGISSGCLSETSEGADLIQKNLIVIKTKFCPPLVGQLIPQTFLPYSLYASHVKEAKAMWDKLLREPCDSLIILPIKQAALLVVFRTQDQWFEPVNNNIKFAIDTLVSLRVLEDDSYRNLVYFSTAVKCKSGGGIDFYLSSLAAMPQLLKNIIWF